MMNKKKGAIGLSMMVAAITLFILSIFQSQLMLALVGLFLSMFLGSLGIFLFLGAWLQHAFPRRRVKSLTRQKDLINIFRGYPR
jgi:hypothetical protein